MAGWCRASCDKRKRASDARVIQGVCDPRFVCARDRVLRLPQSHEQLLLRDLDVFPRPPRLYCCDYAGEQSHRHQPAKARRLSLTLTNWPCSGARPIMAAAGRIILILTTRTSRRGKVFAVLSLYTQATTAMSTKSDPIELRGLAATTQLFGVFEAHPTARRLLGVSVRPCSWFWRRCFRSGCRLRECCESSRRPYDRTPARDRSGSGQLVTGSAAQRREWNRSENHCLLSSVRG
jgi:hypothetical protein